MDMASSSIPANSRIMFIISSMTTGFSDMPSSSAAILSISPTVAPSQEYSPAHVTTIITTDVAATVSLSISYRIRTVRVR
ncbi:MAG: hypothetical protein BWY99_01709 [Synergistetes bacterium ADurb.BinA166]|nr:MAG: hypothetical protein BWY99_01709 [Synergistetes bacterium ADurb.BinA166]